MLSGEHLIGEFYVPLTLDVVAVILFAITGALSAAKQGYDWIGVMAIALVVGTGGGLIRDILLNVRPVLIENEPYLWAVIIGVLLSVYYCGQLARIRWVFLFADALGLAIYAVLGTQKSLEHGLGITSAILIGTINAIGGGLIRDILFLQEPSLLKPGQFYTVIALGTSFCFALLVEFTSLPGALAGILVISGAVVARIFAKRYDVKTRPLKPRGFDSSHWI